MRKQYRKQRFSAIIGITWLILAGIARASAMGMDIGIVTTQQTPLHLRTGPAMHYAIIDKVQKGDPVLVVKTIGEWYLIRAYTSVGDVFGYVRRQYITVLPNITDVMNISADGSLDIPDTFLPGTPVILLKNGDSTTWMTKTVEPFLMQLDTPESQLAWTRLDARATSKDVVAAIVGDNLIEYHHDWGTVAAEADRKRFEHALQHAQCARTRYYNLTPIAVIQEIGECPLNGSEKYRMVEVAQDRFVSFFEPDLSCGDDSQGSYRAIALFNEGIVTFVAGGSEAGIDIIKDVKLFQINQRVHVKYAYSRCGKGISLRKINDISGRTPIIRSLVDFSM